MRTITLTLTLVLFTLLTVTHCLAEDLEQKLNFALQNPAEIATIQLEAVGHKQSLATIANLRDKSTLGKKAAQKEAEKLMVALAERDLIIAKLLKKVVVLKDPNVSGDIVDALEQRVKIARARHFISKVELD